jgi:hypothetical protein
MGGPALAAKFHAYAGSLVSRQWAKERRALPILLFIVPDYRQEERVRFLAQRLLLTSRLLVPTTTNQRVEAQETQAAIWQAVSKERRREAERRAWPELLQQRGA